jgi:hypothetical protein
MERLDECRGLARQKAQAQTPHGWRVKPPMTMTSCTRLTKRFSDDDDGFKMIQK